VIARAIVDCDVERARGEPASTSASIEPAAHRFGRRGGDGSGGARQRQARDHPTPARRPRPPRAYRVTCASALGYGRPSQADSSCTRRPRRRTSSRLRTPMIGDAVSYPSPRTSIVVGGQMKVSFAGGPIGRRHEARLKRAPRTVCVGRRMCTLAAGRRLLAGHFIVAGLLLLELFVVGLFAGRRFSGPTCKSNVAYPHGGSDAPTRGANAARVERPRRFVAAHLVYGRRARRPRFERARAARRIRRRR